MIKSEVERLAHPNMFQDNAHTIAQASTASSPSSAASTISPSTPTPFNLLPSNFDDSPVHFNFDWDTASSLDLNTTMYPGLSGLGLNGLGNGEVSPTAACFPSFTQSAEVETLMDQFLNIDDHTA